jgi:hypothetical protein
MIACQHCGASLEIPLDLAAMAVRCHYCGEQTQLPNDVLQARRQERMSRMAATAPAVVPKLSSPSTGGILVAVVIGVSVLGSLVAIVLSIVMRDDSPTPVTIPHPVIVTPPIPVIPTAKPIASDAKSIGATRTTERMKQLYDKGCKNVIMPPEQTQGDMKLSAKFVANGTCVRMLVITGSAENKLTLTMKTPFGEEVKTPAASNELDFSFCPKQSGPYPTNVTTTNDDFYTVAAVECPAWVK